MDAASKAAKSQPLLRQSVFGIVCIFCQQAHIKLATGWRSQLTRPGKLIVMSGCTYDVDHPIISSLQPQRIMYNYSH